MAESVGDRDRVNKNALLQPVTNTNVTVETSTTTLISAIDVSGYEYKSLELYNADAAQTVIAKVWGSNRASPGTLGGSDWKQIGTDITLSTTDGSIEQWTTPSRWIGVTATGSAQATGNDAIFIAKTS